MNYNLNKMQYSFFAKHTSVFDVIQTSCPVDGYWTRSADFLQWDDLVKVLGIVDVWKNPQRIKRRIQ